MSGTVLLIEDDESLATLAADYLELAGFTCRVEADGAKGLETALAGDWDLLVLDLMLPGVEGFEICRRVREHSEKPVLILSARSEDIDKIRALGLGADDYVTKPFSPGELIARIKSRIERYRRLTANAYVAAGEAERGVRPETRVLEVRSLRLDAEAKRVWSRSGEVDLTAKEFELLRLFMRHPGRVFSREELFARVWGEEHFGDTSTVTVHIRKIREKIEENPAEPQVLETVWGMGYRIRV